MWSQTSKSILWLVLAKGGEACRCKKHLTWWQSIRWEVALHHSEGDKPNLPLQVHCFQRGREGKQHTREGVSLCRLCRQLAMHSNSWALWLICPKAVIYSLVRDPRELHNGFTRCAYKGNMHSRSDSLYIYTSFFPSRSLPSLRSYFLCINQLWQLCRREGLMWISIMINFIWRRYVWYILMQYLLWFFLT